MADGSEEGEIIDSASHSEQEDKEETETIQEESAQWTTIVKGPRKRKLNDKNQASNSNKKKKRNRTPLCYAQSEDTEEKTAPPVPEPFQSSETLNQNQKGLLRYLSDIATNLSTSSPYKGKHPMTEFKTADFQTVLRHILTGEPIVVGKKGKLVHVDLLRRSKVVVIWLSCFSRDDYKENEDCLKGVKSLFNDSKGGGGGGEFYLCHPGSDRFAHFGLETFMEMERKEDKPLTSLLPSVVELFTKRHCLLSHQQLIEHEFPLPSQLHPPPTNSDTVSITSNDLALLSDYQPSTDNLYNIPDYITLEVWPSDMKESLSDTSIDEYPIFAIDCEMVKTEFGSELARVSIINEDLSCVYTSLVKPANQIVDYLTRFSGVSEEMLSEIQVSLNDVHVKLREVLPPKCILIGHSLENDLAALRLHHPYIIDTSLLFTPLATPRCKLSLKKLVKKLLNKDIQVSLGGHDPTEDALACMELVKKKLLEGRNCIVQWNQNKKWLPVHLANRGISTKIIDKQSMSLLYTDRSEYNGQPVANDLEAVTTAKIEVVKDTLFTFVQLHALEYLRREEREILQDEISTTLLNLDTYTCDIINACTKSTLILVVCGSSNIRQVRELQRNPDTPSAVLKTAVKKAREGIVLVGWK